VTLISFFDGSGFFSLVETKTLSGRIVVLGWEISCMLLISSYTANLAQVLVSSNAPVTSLSATSFVQLQATARPTCLRDGTAISSLISPMLRPRQVVSKPGGMYTAQSNAASDLRSGACDGFIQPLWMAQDMLISGANAPCDLRLLFPAISSAAGGWVTASSWRRQQASRNGTAATGGACTGVLADAFGFYLQQIASSSMNELRAAQQERLRNSTCSVTGEPVDRAGADPSQLTQLDVSHFAGMFIVLLVAGLCAVLSSGLIHSEADRAKKHASALTYFLVDQGGNGPPDSTMTLTRRASAIVERSIGKLKSTVGLTPMGKSWREQRRAAREEKIAMQRLVSDLVTSRPPSTEEWQAGIDQRLAKMEARLGGLCDTIERKFEAPVPDEGADGRAFAL